MKVPSLPVDGGFCGYLSGGPLFAAGFLPGIAVLLAFSLTACVSGESSPDAADSQAAASTSAAPDSGDSSAASSDAESPSTSETTTADDGADTDSAATVAETSPPEDLPRGTLPSGVSWIKPKGEIKPYPFDHCAVSRRKIRNKKFYRYYQGHEVILCCTACKKTFDADPDPFMPRIKEAVALAEAE